MEYLTDEDYAIAAENGIKRGTVYSRFHNSGWSVERSINKPTMRPTAKTGSKYDKYFAIGEKHGIPSNTIRVRLSIGWSANRACTVPVNKYVRRSKNEKAKKLV